MTEGVATGAARKPVEFVTLVVLTLAVSSIWSSGVVRADPVPTLTVTPSSGLVDQQVVTVSADGLAPNTQYALRECDAGAASCVSLPSLGIETDAGGSLGAEFTVGRVIHTAAALGLDCGARAGRCAIAVTAPGLSSPIIVERLISFDPSVPVVRPTVAVDPTSGLVDGQVVQVEASGFVPDELVFVILCGVDLEVLSCANGRPVTPDSAGRVALSFNVRRFVAPNLGVGPTFDCASAPGACAVYVAAPLDASRTGWVPISFDPDVPIATDALLATPTSDLSDGQLVTITGTVKSSESLAAIQCRTSQTGNDASVCDQSTLRLGVSSAAGAVRIDVAVRAMLRTPSGTIDCTVSAGVCSLVVGRFASNGEIARFAVSFANATSPPTALVQPAFTG